MFSCMAKAHTVQHTLILYRMMSDWKVELVNDSVNELYVEFQGPKDSEQYYLPPRAIVIIDMYKRSAV